ncbi:MAG TPA: L-threonylcarbamoyladenylate synthase [Candidatus Paceibacterota bacterium]|jgi:L-threonylcarbamoyladenylate synthase|nr:L-threonylcarbamoyladenylate synthase [Candidatus Paceibacterota bacterium]
MDLISVLKNNNIAIVATDTLYGILGNAFNKETVERIYDVKGRDENKPFIVLIPAIETVSQFGATLTDDNKAFLEKYWPGPLTVILPISPEYQEQFSYLHRGTNELAFRLPAKQSLQELLRQTGPLVAPSANPQGLSPAFTVEEAKNYFGDGIDYYQDEGRVEGLPSTIVRISNGEITVIRQGSISIA